MGKGGRIACIFTPFVLTLASLICIFLVFLGGTNKSSSTLEQFFFFKADLSNFTSTADVNLISNTNIDNSLLSAALGAANTSANLKQYYAIYLWNYCADNGNAGANNDYSFCSARENSFWFNPVEVWGLNGTGVEKVFPNQLKDGLKAYQTASHWMFVAYVCALIATIVELVVGIFAICSRWGSFFTTLASGVSSLFTVAASLTATVLFSTIVGALNTTLKPYHIHTSLGRSLFITTWLAVVFSFASGFFWFLSVCCCSGRSPYHKDADRHGGYRGMFGGGAGGRRSVIAEKTPYTYERVGSPYLGAQQSGVAHQNVGAWDSYANNQNYSHQHLQQPHQQHGDYAPVHGGQGQSVPMINLQRASREWEDHGHGHGQIHSPNRAAAYDPYSRQ